MPDHSQPGHTIPFTDIAAIIAGVKGIAATAVTPSTVLACDLGQSRFCALRESA